MQLCGNRQLICFFSSLNYLKHPLYIYILIPLYNVLFSIYKWKFNCDYTWKFNCVYKRNYYMMIKMKQQIFIIQGYKFLINSKLTTFV
jgi:hypothetical protein